MTALMVSSLTPTGHVSSLKKTLNPRGQAGASPYTREWMDKSLMYDVFDVSSHSRSVKY